MEESIYKGNRKGNDWKLSMSSGTFPKGYAFTYS